MGYSEGCSQKRKKEGVKMIKAKNIETKTRESVFFKHKGKPEKFYRLVLPTGRKFDLIRYGRRFRLSSTALSEEESLATGGRLDYQINTITYIKQEIAKFVNSGLISSA
jgi:hypothetical protein